MYCKIKTLNDIELKKLNPIFKFHNGINNSFLFLVEHNEKHLLHKQIEKFNKHKNNRKGWKNGKHYNTKSCSNLESSKWKVIQLGILKKNLSRINYEPLAQFTINQTDILIKFSKWYRTYYVKNIFAHFDLTWSGLDTFRHSTKTNIQRAHVIHINLEILSTHGQKLTSRLSSSE